MYLETSAFARREKVLAGIEATTEGVTQSVKPDVLNSAAGGALGGEEIGERIRIYVGRGVFCASKANWIIWINHKFTLY